MQQIGHPPNCIDHGTNTNTQIYKYKYKKYDPVFYPAELQQIGHLPNCIDYDTIPLSELVISQTMIGVMWLRYKLSLFCCHSTFPFGF